MLQHAGGLARTAHAHILTGELCAADPGIKLGKDRGACLASEHPSERASGHRPPGRLDDCRSSIYQHGATSSCRKCISQCSHRPLAYLPHLFTYPQSEHGPALSVHQLIDPATVKYRPWCRVNFPVGYAASIIGPSLRDGRSQVARRESQSSFCCDTLLHHKLPNPFILFPVAAIHPRCRVS